MLPSRNFVLALLIASGMLSTRIHAEEVGQRRFLYVATPGIRNYLEYGGHGLLVFDIDNGHKFVRRIPTAGLNEDGKTHQRERNLRLGADEPGAHQHRQFSDVPKLDHRKSAVGTSV